MLASCLHAFGILGLALAWLSYDHYRPWVNFHAEALALAAVGLLAISTCLRAASSTWSTQVPRIVWWVLAVALVPWLQWALGISLFAGDALLASLYLCGLAVAIWVGHSYAMAVPGEDAVLKPVFYVLWLAALASAAIGLLQWLSLQESLLMYVVQTDAGDRAMGNLGQPNQLATLLLMGIASLAWTFERKAIGWLGLVVGVGFLSFVLVLTQSRAGVLSAVTAGLFLCWKSSQTPMRIRPRHLLLWLFAFGVMLWLFPILNDGLLMGDRRSMNVVVDNARITIWKQMLNGIAHAPWVGYGWNQTPTAHAFGGLSVPGSLTYTNAHNIVLDVVAWNGVPLGLLLTAVCIYWFLSRMWGVEQRSGVYAMACLLPVALHSMVEYPFAYAYFLMAVGLMIGVVEAATMGVRTTRLHVRWVGALVVMWFGLGSFMVVEYLRIEEDFRVVRFENMNIGQTPAEYVVPDVWMFSHMATMLQASRLRPHPGMTAGEMETLRKASLRFPYGALGLRYAMAMGLNGNPVGAQRQMAMIRGMYGEYYYQAAVASLREMQEKYPELSAVTLPQ